MRGRILKGIGSFYTVLGEDGAEYVCRARGLFRKQGISPVPGDRVEFSLPTMKSDGYLQEILPRKNKLVRPAVANVDSLVIVLAASSPKPDPLLLDKLLLQCQVLGVEPILVLNKIDEADEEACAAMLSQYAGAGAKLAYVSAHTAEGLAQLKALLQGRVSCFAGQSAVGKSSLINALIPELELEVGELSRKTERGKNTTRRAQLWPVFGGAIVDTPGFSLLDAQELEPSELCKLYPEMQPYTGLCRFAECMHIKEPDCAVKDAVSAGQINRERYDRYVLLAEELMDMKKHKYD